MAADADQDGEGSDDTLLARIATGDERAFRTFMDRHLDRVHAIAYRFSGKRSDAEDIAQETFLRIWKQAETWRPGGAKPSTWIYRIVSNLCIDHARKQKWRRYLPFGDVPEPADYMPGPETQSADRDALQQVAGAIDKLPAKQRMALVLSATAGHSNAEIAAILGGTTGAVEQAIFRARTSLKETFDGKR